jgi:hypothetical protein
MIINTDNNMRILNFNDFKINESDNTDEYITVDGIRQIMDDGYEISAENFCDSDRTFPMGSIIVTKDSNSSITLAYCGNKGEIENEISIPKDSVDIKNDDDNNYIITIDPDRRWLNVTGNRAAIEDFIEDFTNCKMECDGNTTRMLDGVKGDVYTILDIIGIPYDIESAEKVDANQYEVKLGNGMLIDVKKRSHDDMVGNFDVYKKHDATYPSFSIRSDKGKMGFHFDSDDLPASEVESDIMDVSKNDYLNYLLKKSLGIETHSDKERLYKHFVDSINSHDFDYIKSDDIKTQEKGKRSADYIKSLKNMVSTFVPEKRISEVYPRKD